MLANTSTSACEASSLSDGTVTVVSVTRDGVPVGADVAPVHYAEGLGRLVAAKPVQLAAGAELTLSSTSSAADGNQELMSVGWSPAERNLAARWRLDTPGTYRVSATYALPIGLGTTTPSCRGFTSPATATFTIAVAGDGFPLWLLFILIAVVLLVLAFVWRRWVAVGLIVFAGLVTPAVRGQTPPSRRRVTTGSSRRWTRAWRHCGSPAATRTTFCPHWTTRRIRLRSSTAWSTRPIRLVRTRIEWWTGTYSDPCGLLVHELAYAFLSATNAQDSSICGTTGMSYEEVWASLAENAYLAAHGKKLRESYGFHKLPKTLDECAKPQLPSTPTGVRATAIPMWRPSTRPGTTSRRWVSSGSCGPTPCGFRPGRPGTSTGRT